MKLLVCPQAAAQTQTLPTLPLASRSGGASASALLPEECAGEAGSGLRVGLAVDAGQVALHHA